MMYELQGRGLCHRHRFDRVFVGVPCRRGILQFSLTVFTVLVAWQLKLRQVSEFVLSCRQRFVVKWITGENTSLIPPGGVQAQAVLPGPGHPLQPARGELLVSYLTGNTVTPTLTNFFLFGNV